VGLTYVCGGREGLHSIGEELHRRHVITELHRYQDQRREDREQIEEDQREQSSLHRIQPYYAKELQQELDGRSVVRVHVQQ
jgi:hypothetical protein